MRKDKINPNLLTQFVLFICQYSTRIKIKCKKLLHCFILNSNDAITFVVLFYGAVPWWMQESSTRRGKSQSQKRQPKGTTAATVVVGVVVIDVVFVVASTVTVDCHLLLQSLLYFHCLSCLWWWRSYNSTKRNHNCHRVPAAESRNVGSFHCQETA